MRNLLSCVAALAVVAIAGAQPPQTPEMPKPGAAHKKLAPMVGEWDVAIKNPAGGETKGTMRTQWGPGRMSTHSQFKGEVAPMMVMEGRGVTGYDFAKKKYVGVWTDSFTPGIMTVEGEFDETGKVYTERTAMADESGKQSASKMVTKLADKNKFTFEIFRVEGGKEELEMSMVFTRKPAPAKGDKKGAPAKPAPAPAKAEKKA